jgi:viroplasmin and RNaseH domain-containing protein
MKKLLLLLFINLIFAYDINDLLKIEAKLYPKIIKLEKTTLNNTLKIAIIYNHSSQKLAKKFSLLLKKENIISYPVFYKNPIPKANAYVLTFKNVTPTLFNKLLKRKKLIFNIYPNELEYSMVGVYIGLKVKPLINPKLIKKANIKLNPIIFRVSEVYENE